MREKRGREEKEQEKSENRGRKEGEKRRNYFVFMASEFADFFP
jgi:hypothetical protein